MSKWKPIGKPPPDGKACDVLLFMADAKWHGLDGSVDVPVPAHMRYLIAYWDGKTWRHAGSNHKVFEFDLTPGDMEAPTHWSHLPAPPESFRKEGR